MIFKNIQKYTDVLTPHVSTKHIIFFLFFLGLLVYGNALFNGFVMDDEGLILKNKAIHTFDFIRFFKGSIFDYGGSAGGVYYRPVQSILFATMYLFAGEHAFLYHLIQILLHITNCVLVLFLCKKFFSQSISFVITLIFLVHPMQVESVSYIASTQDVLFVFWGLLFLHLLIKYSHSLSLLWLPYVFLFFGILSKESGLLFLPLGLAYVILLGKKHKALHTYMFFTVIFFYVMLRMGVGGLGIHSNSEFSMMRLSLSERIIHIPAILLFYLKTFFFPLDLVAVQSWTFAKISVTNFFLPLLLVASFFGILFYGSYQSFRKTKQYSIPVFFGFWFVLGLALHIQVTPLDVTVADRYFYFPMIGLLGVFGYLYQHLGEKRIQSKKIRQYVILGICILVLCLSIRTVLRNADWKDSRTVALHDLQIQPDNYQLLSALGAMYLGEKQYEKAIYYLKQSVSIYPHWGISMYNLAVSYHMSHRPKEARMYYEKSLQNAPLYVSAHENLAILLLYEYSPKEASIYTKNTLKKFPQSIKMWRVLYEANVKLGNTEQASQAAQMYYQMGGQ